MKKFQAYRMSCFCKSNVLNLHNGMRIEFSKFIEKEKFGKKEKIFKDNLTYSYSPGFINYDLRTNCTISMTVSAAKDLLKVWTAQAKMLGLLD